MSQHNVEKINQLRAFGAIGIFSFHYYHFTLHGYIDVLNSTNPFLLLIYHGYFVVYLFFALSGFLCARQYKEKLDTRLFFKKRIISILPAYYLCLLTYFILFSDTPSLLSLLAFPFSIDITHYSHIIGHLWFINRLLLCYLCFPLIWMVHNKLGAKGLLTLLGLLMGGGLLWSFKTELVLETLYGSFTLCFSHFLCSAIIGFYFKGKQSIKIIALMSSAFVVGVTGIHQLIWEDPLAYYDLGTLWYYFLVIWFALFIYYYSQLTFRLPHLINVIVNELGQMSYFIYLFHFLVIQFVATYKVPLLSNAWADFLLLLTVTLAISYTAKFSLRLTYTAYQMLIGFRTVKD
jgi:peptidoglycan/LPS O-acetylase OafA/YrhL